MRSRSNGGIIGAYQLPTQNYANGVFFIHDAAIYNTGSNPIWPLASGFIYSATGGTITTAVDNANYKVHSFTANGTFTVATGSGELEILLVGGGGAGGMVSATGSSTYYRGAGGGGGGQVVLVRTWVEPGTTFTVTLGPGGPQTQTTGARANGSYTYVSSVGRDYFALGGGGGGSMAGSVTSTMSGYKGGSGGGGAAAQYNGTYYNGAGGAVEKEPNIGTIYSYANIGASGSYTSPSSTSVAAGGGGGASGTGYPGIYGFDASLSGRGGDGWLYPRTNIYYGAGGGGGRSNQVGTQTNLGGLAGAYPGTGHGGNGSYSTGQNGGAAAASTGSGGGGAYVGASPDYFYGGAGSQGVVVFCYRYR